MTEFDSNGQLAKSRGEVVNLSARAELFSLAEVATRLGMSRSTVLRRIADGDLKATKVGSHHCVTPAEFKRYSHDLTRRMAEVRAADIEDELFAE